MAGNLTSIHQCESSFSIPGTHVTYRSGPARARRGSATLPSESFPDESPLIGRVQGAIGNFVAARQLAGHPIAVSRWDGKE